MSKILTAITTGKYLDDTVKNNYRKLTKPFTITKLTLQTKRH